MISRITVFSLLLGLMLALGIRMWNDAHPDDCARTLAIQGVMPPSEYVISGTRQIVVPCNDWIMRQPLRIQILCLVDLTMAVMFVLNALADLRGWLQMRRRMRQPN
ncbi:MAG TPA: hypothetical protein VGN01_06100 [Acidobacteriaceae bacterium]